MGVLHSFNQYFSYIMSVRFIGRGKQMYQEKTTDLLYATDILIFLSITYRLIFTLVMSSERL